MRQMAIDGAVSALAPRALDASLGSSRSPPTLKFSGFIGFGDRRQPSRFSLCVGGVCGGGGGGGGGGGSERGGQQIRRHDTEFTEFRRLSNDRPARTRSEALHGRRRLTAPTLRLVFVVGASIFSCSGLRIRRRIACARLSRRVCVCVCVCLCRWPSITTPRSCASCRPRCRWRPAPRRRNRGHHRRRRPASASVGTRPAPTRPRHLWPF